MELTHPIVHTPGFVVTLGTFDYVDGYKKRAGAGDSGATIGLESIGSFARSAFAVSSYRVCQNDAAC